LGISQSATKHLFVGHLHEVIDESNELCGVQATISVFIQTLKVSCDGIDIQAFELENQDGTTSLNVLGFQSG